MLAVHLLYRGPAGAPKQCRTLAYKEASRATPWAFRWLGNAWEEVWFCADRVWFCVWFCIVVVLCVTDGLVATGIESRGDWPP